MLVFTLLPLLPLAAAAPQHNPAFAEVYTPPDPTTTATPPTNSTTTPPASSGICTTRCGRNSMPKGATCCNPATGFYCPGYHRCARMRSKSARPKYNCVPLY